MLLIQTAKELNLMFTGVLYDILCVISISFLDYEYCYECPALWAFLRLSGAPPTRRNHLYIDRFLVCWWQNEFSSSSMNHDSY